MAVAGRAEGGARGRRGHRSTNGHDPGGEPQRTRTAWREMHTHTGHARAATVAWDGPPTPGSAETSSASERVRDCALLTRRPVLGRGVPARSWGKRQEEAEPVGPAFPQRGSRGDPRGRGGPRGAGVWPLRLLGCTGKVPAFGEDAWGPSHFNRKSAQDREPSRCSPERPQGDAGSAPAASDQVPRGRRHGHAPPQEAQGTGSARVPQTRRAEPKPGAGRPRPTADGGGGGRPELPLPPSLALHQRTSPTPRTARRSRHPGRDACVTVVRHS